MMPYTGERLIPGRKGLELLELEHRARYELVVPSVAGKRVLDLGCGTGYGANRLAGSAREVVGVDVSPESVEYARGAFQRANLAFEVGDLASDELIAGLGRDHPGPFDVVVFFEVLEHLPEPARVVARLKSLLHPDGLVFLSTPNIARAQAAVDRDNPFHVVEYGEEELVGILEEQFSTVRLFRQNVNLVSRILPAGEGALRQAAWRAEAPGEAKYFVAVCSDRAADVPVEGLELVTSDAHLLLLRARLDELRTDQQQRNQVLEQLRARLKAQDLLERQERLIADLAEERGEALAEAAGARKDRLAELEAARQELAARLAGEEAHRRELERRVEERERRLSASADEVQALERQVEERELRLASVAERAEELRRQVEERSAAGAALAGEVEELRRGLAGKDLQLDAARRRLQALQQSHREIEKRSRASEPAATVDALRGELATWRQLADDLAGELQRILTSRRWRLVMPLVRLRNFLLRRHEGDPIAGHLNRHLRRAGQKPVRPRGRRTAAPKARSPLFRDLGPRGRMRLLGEAEKAAEVERLSARPQEALVSVVLPTWNRAEELVEAIRSVQAQSYRSWELLVVDDGSTDATAEVVAEVQSRDPRVEYLRIDHTGVSAARNAGLERARGAFVAYLDSDNVWDPHYLLFMVHALLDSGRRCGYCALRLVDDDRHEVFYRRQRFDYRTLLKNNYIDLNVFVHRAELVAELGGFDTELHRWVDWDLILRYVEKNPPAEVPVLLCDYRRGARWRQITSGQPKSYKLKVLNKHLIDWEGQRRDLGRRTPGLVSVVVLNYDLPEMTETCVCSILAAGGPEVEVVVVDNGSAPARRRKLRAALRRLPGVRLVETYENYGFALGCNLGAAAARGEYVIWLNNDTEVSAGWIEPLIRPLREDPTIGMVGARLLWPDGRLQHGGMVFGPRSKIPYHIYQGFPGDHPAVGKARRFRVLNGACLAVRAADVVALHGFDPIYVNGCEDVDFCLRMWTVLGKEGFYDPASVVIHHESQTEGRSDNIRFNREVLVDRWRDVIEADDHRYYAEDGFVVERYVKRGAERDGETALYRPELAPRPGARGTAPPAAGERTLQVGFVSIWYERGVTYVARQLATSLERDPGFETHVLARWESHRFRNAGSVLHPRVVNAGDDPSPQETVAWARQRRLDVVVFVEIHPNDWKRVEALQAAGFKVLCYEHLDILRLDKLDEYQRVDGFLANSFFGWRTWQETQPGKTSLLLPWGIPPELVPARTRQLAADDLRFVHVAGWGGLEERKNTSLCIEAFHQAAPPGARLRVYSQSPLERYGEACAEIVRADPAIEVEVGTLDDIWAAYRDADVLLWPSKREGLGLPILEALVAGLPVLISDGWLMKEWPVLGEHAVVCRARAGEPSAEPVPRYLPLLDVDRDDLVHRIRTLAASRDELAAMTAAVRRDRDHWLWSWQAAVLAAQLRRFVAEGAFAADPADYLPREVVAFEERRAASRGEGPRFLFIAGCQRSGTTALLQLLNADERFAIGRERFKYCRSGITPAHFCKERFFALDEQETNYRKEELYGPLRARWDAGKVRYVGDKVPFYYKDLFYLAKTFPGCRILFLVRGLEGVAASYNARAEDPGDRVWKPTMDYRRAVEDWNESLERLDEFVAAGHRDTIHVVQYERFFAGDEAELEDLYRFLELPVEDDVRAAYRALTADWQVRSGRSSRLSGEMREYLAERRNGALETRCLSLCTPRAAAAAAVGSGSRRG